MRNWRGGWRYVFSSSGFGGVVEVDEVVLIMY